MGSGSSRWRVGRATGAVHRVRHNWIICSTCVFQENWPDRSNPAALMRLAVAGVCAICAAFPASDSAENRGK